jgi:4-amino-4-deoxy-L-arabinose transferase-like glycosyltransferase
MRRALLLIAAVALAHSALYIVAQQADWTSATAWTDQAGYQRLGAGMATAGSFTRYPESPTYIPEVIRTPGYPALVALVYTVFGVGNNMAVAVVQAFIFAGICWLVFALVRRATDPRTGVLAAGMTALYSPLAYFSALILTELLTAAVATLAMVACLKAARSGRLGDFALAGALFSATTLVRPAFFLLPFFMALAMPMLVRSQRSRPMLAGWGCLAVVAALVMAPWFAYNYVNWRCWARPVGGVVAGTLAGPHPGRADHPG